ncbi:MAG: GGDEF domain-containing protein [Epsilonproteobacteria bacterium]|nr:GGDEF domain-containing protein [Campylobacterota bacterium]
MKKGAKFFALPDQKLFKAIIPLYETAYAGQLLVLSFATVIFFNNLPPQLLFGWAGLHLGNLYLRYRLTDQLTSDGEDEERERHTASVLALYAASMTVTGLLWALMPFFTEAVPPLYIFLVYALIIALTFGATMFIGPIPILFFLYIAPMNLTMMGELIVKSDPVFHAAALFLVVIFFFALKAAQMHAKNIKTMLEGKEHAIALKNHFEEKASIDRLTGLFNREKFFNSFEWILREARENGHRFALFFIDVNKFKQINDTYGHDAGDKVLQEVAKRLRASIRENDLLARLSGDEFVMVIQDTQAKERAKEVAKRIEHAFCEPIECDKKRIHVGLSIGIALYPKHGITAKTLMRHADEAMYFAKRNKKSFTFYK